MNRSLAAIGRCAQRAFPLFGLLALCLLPPQQGSAQGVYSTIKQQIEAERATQDIDEAVAREIEAIYKPAWAVELTDVYAAAKGEKGTLCARQPPPPKEQREYRVLCEDIFTSMREIAKQEERVRRAGRNMQLTATSYELPISELPGHPMRLPLDMRAITAMLSAGTGSSKVRSSGSLIRTRLITDIMPESNAANLLQDVGEALETLKKEEQMAAIWRYQHGWRFVAGYRNPPFPATYQDSYSGPATERELLFKRWRDIEANLTNIYQSLPWDPNYYSPPLEETEVAYFIFPDKLMRDNLPDNVIVWARMDGRLPNHPLADVGLHFRVPLEPVFPKLRHNDEPILGGRYPPEPVYMEGTTKRNVDGAGLCSHPLARRGYLCRPYNSGNKCPPVVATGPNVVTLASCQPGYGTGHTILGPDVCRDIGYKVNNSFDPIKNCKVNIRCVQDFKECGYTGTITAGALTSPKRPDGTIEICQINDFIGRSEGPLLYHELSHAYQQCDWKPAEQHYTNMPFDEAAKLCCRLEGEGNRAMCQLYQKHGLLKNPLTGTPIDLETCNEIFTNIGCRSSGQLTCTSSQSCTAKYFPGCPLSKRYSLLTVIAVIASSFNEGEGDIPTTCEEAISTTKPYLPAQTLLHTINKRDDVCTPLNRTQYPNRIGNNMCFIGQCIEESAELRNLVPGRIGNTTQDEHHPWEIPMTADPLAKELTAASMGPMNLPPYEPRRMMEEFEASLCQLAGLPNLTPPSLCAEYVTRRLLLQQPTYGETAQGLLQIFEQPQQSREHISRLGDAMGSRIGADLYRQYFRSVGAALAEMIKAANTLFTEMKDIKFPSQMCPISPGLPRT